MMHQMGVNLVGTSKQFWCFIHSLMAATFFGIVLISADVSHAGGGSVDASGNIDLQFHFRFPPTANDITRVREQIQRSSQSICDATEGRMRIGSARLSAGGASEAAGDIWYFPPDSLTRSSSSGAPIQNDGARIQLTYGAIRSDVVTHELGHLVFGLGDQYDEQRRIGTACGIGRAFDSPDETNHTIMAQANSQRCQDSLGNFSNSCFNNSDCTGGSTCPLPPLMSEFSTAVNNDLLRGDSVLPADTCPSPRPGDRLDIKGLVYSSASMDAFDSTDFDTADMSAPGSRRVELLDSVGNVPRVGEESSHIITIWPEHKAAQSWTLHFGIDDGEIDGTDGELTILDTLDVTFNGAGNLDAVDGVSISDPAFSNPSIAVTNFTNGASDVTLEVIFDTSGSDRFRESGVTPDRWLSRSGITAGGQQQLGNCPQTMACEQRWNTSTDRWEATSVTSRYLQRGEVPLSDWEQIVDNMSRLYGLSWTAPSPLPNPNPPASCSSAGNVDFDVVVAGSDQIVLIIDRSLSMNKERNNFGDVRQRIDWAKAGARTFADLQSGAGVDVGFISFNHNVSAELPLRQINDAAVAAPGDHELDDFKDRVNGLTTSGNTAIGDALALALDQLNTAAATEPTAQQAVFLLTDGENNRGDNDPQDVAQQMRDQGIQIFAVPLGNLTDQEFLERISDETGGSLLASDDGLELPTLYAELYARFRGEAPVLPRTRSAVRGQGPIIFSAPLSETGSVASLEGELPELETFTIPVEPGADRLNVILSTRNDKAGSWNPALQLRGPAGEVFTHSSPGVIVDDFYRIIRVPAPSAGDWQLTVSAQTSAAQFSYLLGHVENAEPDCYAGVSPRRVVNGSAAIELTAAATLGGPLGEGVSYIASVTRPDGSTITVPLSMNESGIDASGLFNSFIGRGRYDVSVACRATTNARFAPGERASLDELLDAPKATPFLRHARTSFFVNAGGYPPLPGSGDADNDGISNSDEGTGDADGDGLPNNRDEDSDGDDIVDSNEVDPTGDFDGDGLVNYLDPDADNDGVIDGLDPDPLDPSNPTPSGVVGKGFEYSFHVGSAYPLGDLNDQADSNIYLQADLGYQLTDRIDLKARLGFAQFTEETSTLGDNPNVLHLSANVQWLIPTATSLNWYLQAGPGIYDPKFGSTDIGFNIGAGGRLPINSGNAIEFGVDYHRINDDFDTEFLSFQLGVLFQ